MLIIIEGPDCVGKSTLAQALVRYLSQHYMNAKIELLHRGPPAAHPLDEYEVPLLDYRSSINDHHIVCDRWHLGEVVYPAVLGRESVMTEAVLRHIELLLVARGALMVTITGNPDQIRACVRERGDELVTAEHVDAIHSGYLDAAARTSLHRIDLDVEHLTTRDTVTAVINEAENAARHTQKFTKFVTYVGPTWPQLLLLGDVRATGADPDDPRPAFMPYHATSGYYLFSTLGDAARVNIGVANACDVDDVDALWNSLGRPTTVALGRNARAAVQWADRVVPHPQWVRRFKHHSIEPYRDAILGVRPWELS